MKKTFLYILGLMFLLPGLTSCEEYLDKAPESIISEDDAFKNFKNFQGFVERVTNTIPQIAKSNWAASFNWGEDEIITTGTGANLFGSSVDRGSYRDYMNNMGSDNYSAYFRRNWSFDGNNRWNKDFWGGGWASIRTMNQGLEALAAGKLIEATAEQRKFLEGQMYFWRAYFHSQTSTFFGGLPYVDTVLPSDEPLRLPRLEYQEMADKCIEDLEKAVELLPIDWDKTSTGTPTKGNNTKRPNKIWAMALLGKVQLYAGSPLMNAGINGQPTDYNEEYCKAAANTFGKLLTMIEAGQTQYKLVDFEDFHTLVYTRRQDWLVPGGTEAIIRGPNYETDSDWRQSQSYQCNEMANGDGIVFHPTANYVQYYGMANGLPLDDPASGWSNTQPWKDRDPRFYNDIIYDGLKLVEGTMDGPEEVWRYAALHTGGQHRQDPSKHSRTGYLTTKFLPQFANRWDKNEYGWTNAVNIHVTLLRLADVYLMYAEAAAQADKANAGNAKFNFSKTAAEAVNVIRDRAGVGHVADKYVNNLDGFMSELRRERAVELAFEGHRFTDLRRWLLLTRAPYNVKTAVFFDRDGELNVEADPKENKVKNWREEVIVTRNLQNKHYWIPFTNEDVTMYPEFYQNPGW